MSVDRLDDDAAWKTARGQPVATEDTPPTGVPAVPPLPPNGIPELPAETPPARAAAPVYPPPPAQHPAPAPTAPSTSAPATPDHRPGSDGEHALQARLGTARRADRFYDQQVLDQLNERMREFIGRQEMFFLATADRNGECDSTFRAGPPGFLRVFDSRTVAYPEYRGNGVLASLGNLEENPHVGILMVDFFRDRIGLHVNGRARIVEEAEMRARHPELPVETIPGRRAVVWVEVDIEEAYIHCAKHIPHLQKAPASERGSGRHWGTDDHRRKGGDFFGAAAEAGERAARPWRSRPTAEPVGSTDRDAWRREAERALARARRQTSGQQRQPFHGWFG